MEQDTVNERIRILVEKCADKPADFAKATGLTNQNVYDLTSGRKGGPSFASVKKILIAFPEVNERWLLLGEGEMLKSKPSQLQSQEVFSYNAGSPVKALVPHAGDAEMNERVTQTHSQKKHVKASNQGVTSAESVSSPIVGLDLIQQVAQNAADISRIYYLIDDIKSKLVTAGIPVDRIEFNNLV